jgi:KilA-N domain
MDLVYRNFRAVTLIFDSKTSYINVTALAKRYYEQSGIRRNPADWLRLKRTKETLSFIARLHNLNEDELVEIRQGGFPDAQGTFLHPDLSIPFANWLSVEFEYCTTQVVLRRMAESSQSRTTEALKELVGVLTAYFKEAEAFGESIHTTTHRQMERIRSGLKVVEDCLEEINEEDKTLLGDVLLPKPDPEQI